jgi:hypothetical protein
MNLLLLVVLVSILLLVLGNPSPRIPPVPKVPKEGGYKTSTDYYLDAPSVYGAFKN